MIDHDQDAWLEYLRSNPDAIAETEDLAVQSDVIDQIERFGPTILAKLSKDDGEATYTALLEKSEIFRNLSTFDQITTLCWFIRVMAAKCVIEDVDRMVRQNTRLYHRTPNTILGLTRDLCRRQEDTDEQIGEVDTRLKELASDNSFKVKKDRVEMPVDWLERAMKGPNISEDDDEDG
jgi:hypothetical protein